MTSCQYPKPNTEKGNNIKPYVIFSFTNIYWVHCPSLYFSNGPNNIQPNSIWYYKKK